MQKYVWGLAAIAIMVIGFALPSQAASFKVGDVDWSLGGSIRLDTGWQLSDYGDVPAGVNDSTTDFFLRNPTDSRINAKAVYGKTTAFAELGLGAESDVSLRHLYVSYDMGGGNSLLVGRTWTCLAEDSPHQLLWDDPNLWGFGDLSAYRHDQIRFIHAQNKMTFQVAIEDTKEAPLSIENLLSRINTATGADITIENFYTVEDPLPALVLSLGYDGGNFTVTPSLYVQTYKLKGNTDDIDDVTVTSYAVACDASVKLDPVTLSGEIWYGQNLSLFELDLRNNASLEFGAPSPSEDSNDIEDVKSYGGWVQLAANVKPGTLYVGAGYQQAKTELPDELVIPTVIDDEDVIITIQTEDKISTWGAFINYEFPIAKNFTITPELAYFNYGKDALKIWPGLKDGKNKLGTETFIGVHFQYDF